MERPSLPLWERGLKLSPCKGYGGQYIVAPLVGAWIEIFLWGLWTASLSVAPLVGAWIEIEVTDTKNNLQSRRSPCGSVD